MARLVFERTFRSDDVIHMQVLVLGLEIFFPFDGKGDIPNPSLKVNSNTLNIICIDCYSDLTRDEQLLGPLWP